FDSELLGETRQNHSFQIAVWPTPGQNHSLENPAARIAKNQLFADSAARAEPAAGWARTERRVERKMTGLELRQRDSALGTAVLLGEEMDAPIVGALHLDQSFGELECRLD